MTLHFSKVMFTWNYLRRVRKQNLEEKCYLTSIFTSYTDIAASQRELADFIKKTPHCLFS